MLSKDMFVKCFADLMAWYINFEFPFYDENKQETYQFMMWYSAFKSFKDDEFEKIIRAFMEESTYPPYSPTSILDFVKKRLLIKNSENISKAWELFTENLRRYGLGSRLDDETNTYYIPFEVALKRLDDKKIYQVYLEKKSFITDINDFNRDNKRKEFTERYQQLLLEEINTNVKKGALILKNIRKKIGSE